MKDIKMTVDEYDELNELLEKGYITDRFVELSRKFRAISDEEGKELIRESLRRKIEQKKKLDNK